MTINRVLTRLAAVCALNNFMQAPWPTLAGPNIFDSKIEPVEDMAADRAFPCCVVYTDYDSQHWNKGGATSKDRMLTVTLELLVVQAAKVENSGELASYSLDCPVTDSEIEITLDAFEHQALKALQGDTPAAQLFNHLNTTCTNVISRRGASIDGGQRLAARQITLEMKCLREQVAGPINPIVEDFLQRMSTFSDYAQAVDDLRGMMDYNQSGPAGEVYSRTFGYTNRVLDILGTPRSPGGVLPPNIVFLTPSGGTP
jgi:hypothetical protein